MRLKSVVLAILFFLTFLLNYSISEARSGCCSHHGGVCGCWCCDWSDLSAKCAPYYPECSTSSDSYTTTSEANTYSTQEPSTYTVPVNLNSETISSTPSASYLNNDTNIPEPEKTTYSEPLIENTEVVEEKEILENPAEPVETQIWVDSTNNQEITNETSAEKPKDDNSSTWIIVLILTGLGIYFFRKKK